MLLLKPGCSPTLPTGSAPSRASGDPEPRAGELAWTSDLQAWERA